MHTETPDPAGGQLRGVTVEAARALGRADAGRVVVGATGGLVLVRPPPGEAPSAAALIQHLGGSRVVEVISRT